MKISGMHCFACFFGIPVALELSSTAESRQGVSLIVERRLSWLGRKVGTRTPSSGATRGAEITPSVDVASRLAEAFDVGLDFLASDEEMPQAFKDPEMIERWRSLGGLPTSDRDKILYIVDGLIRDARARQAYSVP